ncbi:DUF6887 family protein [Leptothermofonsia sp. ETS-13]|uniref:DUF6887 family protein n=1 Tax=Leptothermofonsia sp. ETS-13 TaxID=3035696 RepID=UPI003BA0C260
METKFRAYSIYFIPKFSNAANYEAMNLDELRQYVLTHREDLNAFRVYIDIAAVIMVRTGCRGGTPGWGRSPHSLSNSNVLTHLRRAT